MTVKKQKTLAVRNVPSRPPTKKQRFEYYCMVYEAMQSQEPNSKNSNTSVKNNESGQFETKHSYVFSTEK